MRVWKTACITLVLMTTTLCAHADDSIAGVVAKAKPAIVTITTYDAKGKEDGQGTGFLIDEYHVVTCYHVIDGDSKASVKTADGKTYAVKGIAAQDRIADVVKLSLTSPIKNINYLSLSKSLPKQGEKVIVVGTPLGLEFTVSDGIVSAIRDVPGVCKMIQLTAPISPGSSGSPVLNLKGAVVGMATSCMVDGQNLNFAVASEQVLELKTSASTLPGKQSDKNEDKAWKEILAGKNCTLNKEYEKALSHFLEATRIDPENADAWRNLYWGYVNVKRFSDAIDAIKKVIKLNPEDAANYFCLAFIDYFAGRHNEAIDALKQAIKIEPNNPNYYSLLGNSYAAVDRAYDAIDAFKNALKLGRDDAATHYMLGIAYDHADKNFDAIDEYVQAIRIDPDYAEAHFRLGLSYGILKRYSDAVDSCKQAIRIKPDYIDAHFMLGGAYLVIDDKGSALDEYKILKTLDAEKANELFNMIYN